MQKKSSSVKLLLFINLLLIISLVSCERNNKQQVQTNWAVDAIWYQIFPGRFHNGDPSNDPTKKSLEGTWPYDYQEKWQLMPWTDAWYKLQSWEKYNGEGFYYNAQLRRYGGDLQGILDKLDYLQKLGINALYLNPIFESPSSHKYGATMYRHIDNNFGPNPNKDSLIWKAETPDDPATWKWTTADKLFLKLIKELHKRNMKIIIDGVFNHVGIPFWAFQDVKEKGKKSKYSDWFVIESFDDPKTPENEFKYHGWYGIPDLPELEEDKNGPCQAYRQHIHNIVKRWCDPNGDGNPEDGIDGWRLDVAHQVSMKFWKDFSSWVREINPDAYLTGEVWWKNFEENVMYDASPYLEEGPFDAVMNYRFTDAMAKAFINQEDQILPSELDQLLGFIRSNYPDKSQLMLQNLMGSHDIERFASMAVNPDRWIDHASNLQYDKDFKIRKPNQAEKQIQKVIIAFQFTYPGAPYIYYGDEVGMWGADDPDCRKPMIWEEFGYEDEKYHPFGLDRPVNEVQVDHDLFNYYKKFIDIRKKYKCLRTGTYKTLLTDDKNMLFAFERRLSDEQIIVLFNLSEKTKRIYPVDLLSEFDLNQWDLIFPESTEKEQLNRKSCKIFYKSIKKDGLKYE
ncbi:MAG: glycoside hydrolase family 13 protein [Candidatus Marinimicrobia bacterium]|nr:glycoside hydrolase family 13 protein [Candidatus Neomarinimicrobiota bacterium]